jgi:hypothetical protein
MLATPRPGALSRLAASGTPAVRFKRTGPQTPFHMPTPGPGGPQVMTGGSGHSGLMTLPNAQVMPVVFSHRRGK